MRRLFTLLALLLFIIGCAGTPQEKAVNKTLKMQSKKTDIINKGIIAGFGIGESADEQMALDEADLNARADIARTVESKVGDLAKRYAEEVGTEFTEHMETVRKSVASTVIRGATMTELDMETVDGRYKVYGVMTLDPKLFYQAMEAELNAQQADVNRFRASKAYQNANEEFKAFDEYKKNSGQ